MNIKTIPTMLIVFILGSLIAARAQNDSQSSRSPVHRSFQYTVSTASYPTNAGTAQGAGTKNINTPTKLTAKPAEGYVIVNWMVGDTVVGTNSTLSFNPHTNATVTANFGFKVSASASPADAATITGAGTYIAGSTVTVSADPDSCFQFSNWTLARKSITENPYTFTISNNVSLIAHFTQLQYTVTAAANLSGAGTITGAGKKECGAKATLVATAKPGFKFVQWIDLANSSEVLGTKTTLAFDVDSDRDIQAVFEDSQPPTFNVSSPTPGEKVSNPAFFISGTIKDNVNPAYIAFSVNGAIWQQVYFAIPALAPTNIIIPVPITIFSNLPPPFTNIPSPIRIATNPPIPIAILSNPPPPFTNIPVPVPIATNPPIPITIAAAESKLEASATTARPWAARVSLNPNSENTLLIYAADTSGNLTKTNKITFDCTAAGYAPASISSLIGTVNLTTEPTFDLSFDADTFAQNDFNTNRGAVGLYTYVQTGSNSAQFVLDYTAPVSRVGSSGPINLSFSDAYTAEISDQDGDTGTIFFSDVPNTAPSSINGRTVVFTSGTQSNDLTTNVFAGGTFTAENNAGTVFSGDYTFVQCSSNAALVQEVITAPQIYAGTSNLIIFTYGPGSIFDTYFYTGYGPDGETAQADYGTFQQSVQPTNPGYAPNALTGLELQFKPTGQGAYNVPFGNATFASFSTSITNVGAAVYTYTRLGPDTSELVWSYIPPFSKYPTNFPPGADLLTFAKNGTARYTNEINGERGTVDFIHAANTVPPSLIGKTATETSGTGKKKDTASISFDYGTFTSGETYGTYTFIPVSPTSALVQLDYTDPANPGLVDELQINFTSPEAAAFIIFNPNDSTPLAAYGTITFSDTK